MGSTANLSVKTTEVLWSGAVIASGMAVCGKQTSNGFDNSISFQRNGIYYSNSGFDTD